MDDGQALAAGSLITLSDRSAAVVRKRGCRVGSGLRLCNNDDGEWYAVVVQEGRTVRHKKDTQGHGNSQVTGDEHTSAGRAGKEEGGDGGGQIDCIVQVEYQLRTPIAVPDAFVSLLYAPPKSHARHRFLLEKATEIGAHVLQPVETERTDASALRTSRSGAAVGWCLDAVEQSDRMLLPRLKQPRLLLDACQQAVLDGQTVYVLVEPRRGGGRNFLEALAQDGGGGAGAAIVVGPEGGWGEGELEALQAEVPQVSHVSLGDGGVLRAETAAIAALSISASYACLPPVTPPSDAII